MHSGFFLHHFRFHLEPKAPLHTMPAYNKGNVIRGGFGAAFQRIVCHSGCREAETCELRNVCPYTAVFQPFVPEGLAKISSRGHHAGHKKGQAELGLVRTMRRKEAARSKTKAGLGRRVPLWLRRLGRMKAEK